MTTEQFRNLTILMFGWEFPPFNAGGLGVACYGLAKALSKQGANIIFVLPKKLDCQVDFCRFIFADNNEGAFKKVLYTAYSTTLLVNNKNKTHKNAWGLLEEVKLYGILAKEIAKREHFDIIHAHDWLSYPAGIAAKKASGKPLIAHIHATEFDRTGGTNINNDVYNIEKQGFQMADKIMAVSNFTKNKIKQHYGVDNEKIKVVHNATEHNVKIFTEKWQGGKLKLVLFLGRLTMQKGPDYFLTAAKKVLQINPNVYFAIAGAGDMQTQLINQAIDLDIAERIIFTGFLRGDELNKLYQIADLYVMPSVSEPFGITAFEALDNNTPILISKQSGAAEVIKNCLKCDFWDTDQMANKILAVLQYSSLKNSLKENGHQEVEKISWDNSAKLCLDIYDDVLKNF